ncbi:SagB/ThcOx family dehydrogenase [Streptomyces thermolilacinus]|uniref:SagB/ThcOx family dehydrogenase n=1 Tax=Streptomyces thermolilacinus TaxID=285540 RepID=UPI001112E26C|nr:SagB/ThcOx family dehydrogenase [Streptomyces thermolilacinus]
MNDAPPSVNGAPPLVNRALSLARSGRVPGPRFPAGPQVTPWPGPALPVPAPLDRLLRLSLAGDRLRPAASAGALHPVNAHLLLGPGTGLPPGRYAYQPVTHRLHPRGAADGDAPPGALAVLTVTARRTASQYGHRGWPLLLLDAGHAAVALTLAGAPAWCPDADGALLAAAAGLPHGPGAPEQALAAVRLTPGPDDALDRWAGYPPGAAPAPDARPVPPVLRAAREVLYALTASGTGTWRPPGVPELPDTALAARRSAPPPFPGVPPAARLASILATASTAYTASTTSTACPGGTGPARPAALAWELVRADDPRAPWRPGDLAVRAARQEWLARTGALLLAHGCPDDADPARVRRDHIAAGYAVGAAQATAAALGVAARPVGSWQRGPHGPAHLVHALALGTATEGNASR